MKKVFISFACFPVLLLISFTSADHSLTGHWISITSDGTKVLLDFNTDNTFKVMVNNETENEGSYKFLNDTFYMYDNNCGKQIEGKYKLNFYTADSLQFMLVQDLCSERAKEVNGGVLKRLPEK